MDPLVVFALERTKINNPLDQLPVIIDEVGKGAREAEDHLLVGPGVGGIGDFGFNALVTFSRTTFSCSSAKI